MNVDDVSTRLAPCPGKPNCVSSWATDASHHIEPLTLTGSQDNAMGRLEIILRGVPRVKIVTVDGGYLHAEFKSALFGFVDDVEFMAAPAAGVIHVRSASRVGYSDLGANRKRVENIRALFQTG